MVRTSEFFSQAVTAFMRGDLTWAAQAFSRFLPEHGEFFGKAQDYLGRIAFKHGDQGVAEQHWRVAVREAPTGQGFFQLAQLFEQQGRLDEAEEAYRRVLVWEPRHTEARTRLGVLLHETGRTREGIRELEQVVFEEPRAVEARYHLGLLCAVQGDVKRALGQLHHLGQVDPDYQPALYLQGTIHQELGDHRQALIPYCKLANGLSRDPDLYLRLATSFRAIGDQAQLLKALERAIGLDGAPAELVRESAELWEARGDYVRAMAHYRRLIASGAFVDEARQHVERLRGIFTQYRMAERAPATPTDLSPFVPPPVHVPTRTGPLTTATFHSDAPRAGRRGTAPLTGPLAVAEAPPEPNRRPPTQVLEELPAGPTEYIETGPLDAILGRLRRRMGWKVRPPGDRS